MKELEKQLKALANRRRLGIIKLLKTRGGTSVGDIAREIRLSFKSTSRHLAVLYAAGIVDKEQISLSVIYRLSDKQSAGTRQLISIL